MWFGALFATLGLGLPIAFVLLAAAIVYFMQADGPSEIVMQRFFAGIEPFPLLAIPLFILAGTVMARGGMAERLFGFADGLVGHWKGGLGQVGVMNSLIMGGMSGSANADAAVDAKILVPIMVKRNYSRDWSTALAACSGIIAPMIPPGIGLIMYGILAEVSIGRLFLAGIVPAFLLAISLAIVVRIIAGRRNYGSSRSRRMPGKELLPLLRRAGWVLFMPVLLIGGLRMGVFTPTELGAIAVIYTLGVSTLVYREMDFGKIVSILREAALVSSIVMLIIGGASALGGVLVREQVPQLIFGSLTSLSDQAWVVLIVINIGLLLVGTLVEGTALLVILAPMLAPLAAGLGVDPVQFGVMMVLNLTIGGLTPPIGTIMFTVCAITGTTPRGYTREVWPMLIAVISVLFLITFVPAFTLVLPNLVFGS
jgi:tripartite ATP-independent transporter DctM subunit